MTQCIGVKPNGELCRGIAARGSDYCPAHAPDRKEARKRSASKAARSKKPHREVADIKLQLAELIQRVQDGELDRGDAAVCGQLFNTMLRGVALQLKIRESEEYEERINALEALFDEQERQHGYGP